MAALLRRDSSDNYSDGFSGGDFDDDSDDDSFEEESEGSQASANACAATNGSHGYAEGSEEFDEDEENFPESTGPAADKGLHGTNIRKGSDSTEQFDSFDDDSFDDDNFDDDSSDDGGRDNDGDWVCSFCDFKNTQSHNCARCSCARASRDAAAIDRPPPLESLVALNKQESLVCLVVRHVVTSWFVRS